MHLVRSKAVRRWFFLAVVLVVIILVLLRFFVIPSGSSMASWQQTTAAMLDTLLAAALTSLLGGFAYLVFFPKEPEESFEIVRSRDIADRLEADAHEADRWQIRARTASYFSRVTLVHLKKNALRRGSSINIQILVLDPSNDAVMEAYAQFRNNRLGATWTADRTRVEIYATVLAAATCRHEAPRLDIEIALSPSLWMLSLDISDQAILITGQNKNENCLRLTKGSDLYQQWRDEYDASFIGSRRFKPVLMNVTEGDLVKPGTETLQLVRNFFQELDLPVDSDRFLAEVIKYKERRHNYA